MTEEQNKAKEKRITVRLDSKLVDSLTKDGKTISTVVRTALMGLGGTKSRSSLKQVMRVLELCKKQGLCFEIPFPDDRPLLIVDYGKSGRDPQLIRVSSLSEGIEYLESAWRQAVIEGLSTSI